MEKRQDKQWGDPIEGKIPPQAIELEEAVLAAVIIECEAFIQIPWLKSEHFYKETHRIIWEVIESFEGRNLDILTLVEALKKTNQLDLIGGPYFITQLASTVSTATNIEVHANIILEKFKKRQCIGIGNHIQTLSFDNQAELEDIGKYGVELLAILADQGKKTITSNRDVGKEVLDNIISITTGSDEVSGISTGFKVMDRMMYGLNEPDLIIIAGRPGMGKTALALAIGTNVALLNTSVLFFSLEMSNKQLYMRQLAYHSEIHMSRFRISNGLNDDQLNKLGQTADDIVDLPLFVDDTPAQSILAIRAKARQLKVSKGIGLIIIDYIQLAKGTGNNREQEISSISGGLKAIAKELKIPVIALSQMNRSVETRGGSKEPQLADLRESGAIEQDADVVIFPFRPEYYGQTEIDMGNGNIINSDGKVKVKFAKNRNGPTGDVLMEFDKRLIKFKNSSEETFSDDSPEQGNIWEEDKELKF